jgi:MerR family copper efflux transcriptional regulator
MMRRNVPLRNGRVEIEGDGVSELASGGAAMQIGEVAARTELSLRSLRHWEEVGLLQPSGRTDGGFRLYTESDVDKILVIRRMKPLGFSLDEMKAVMADLELLDDPATGDADRDAARQRLSYVRDDAAERRARLVRQLDMADEFIGLLAARHG